MSMQTVVEAAKKLEQTPKKLILTRAGLYDLESAGLVGRRFMLEAKLGVERVNTVRTVTKVHFTDEAGLWLEVDRPVLFDRPLRGVQYVVEEPGFEEGWYVGLGDDPRGLFFKLEGFEIQPETTA